MNVSNDVRLTRSQHRTTDVLIVGAGIVGLATAHQLSLRHPDLRIRVVEKEPSVALHQTGRNSGVLHSGIYYKPGSLKATTCRLGKQLMETFCDEHKVAWEKCGKVIVAVNDTEQESLENIYQRGVANGVDCQKITQAELKKHEPHVNGVAGLHVPETGIVDYLGVCKAITGVLESKGHLVDLQSRFISAKEVPGGIEAKVNQETLSVGYLINCAGLYSDRVMRSCGLDPLVKIVPFRGEYFELDQSVWSLCRNLIYPVPDPNFPFLGVHFTRMVHGGVECGPNAVLALSREGYDWKTIRPNELLETLRYSGFRKLATKYWRMGTGEMYRSLSKGAFVKALKRLVPAIEAKHLVKAPSGVRAQAVSPDGKMVDDFLVTNSDRMTHVINAPSPAATASFQIANHILDKFEFVIQ